MECKQILANITKRTGVNCIEHKMDDPSPIVLSLELPHLTRSPCVEYGLSLEYPSLSFVLASVGFSKQRQACAKSLKTDEF